MHALMDIEAEMNDDGIERETGELFGRCIPTCCETYM